jgi:hypothetical protein
MAMDPDAASAGVASLLSVHCRSRGCTEKFAVVFDIDEGHVPAYKLGRVMRIRRSDLDAFLESVRVKPGDLKHLLPGTYKKAPAPEDEEA